MKYIGYHRTSTTSQNLDRGINEINIFCMDNNIPLKKIYTDQTTGTNFERPRYIVMKEDVLESGDVLIITEIDRLGRNKRETLRELQYFKEHQIRVMILELPSTLVDYSNLGNEIAALMMETINNILIEMLTSLAEAENDKRKKRQREGIDAMRARGEFGKYGRPRVMDLSVFGKEFEGVIEGNIKPFELMKKLDMKTNTFYKYRTEYLKSIREQKLLNSNEENI